MNILAVTNHPEINIETFCEQNSAVLSLFVAWNKTLVRFLVKRTFKHYPEINIQTFFKLKSAFLSLYALRKINFFSGVLNYMYQSPCGRREPILC